GIGKTILATIAVLFAIALGLYIEPPLTASLPLTDFLSGLGVILVLTGGLLLWGIKKRHPLTWNPIKDIHTLGFLGSMLPYLQAERTKPNLSSALQGIRPPQNRTRPLPHLVVVQSESFFDPRSWCSAIRPDLFPQIDALIHSASAHGHLQVPAWGANTVRTEYAFLAGMRPDQIGVHRFNPYRKLGQWSPVTLAALLRTWGYRTVCLHPYPAEFYGRNKIFPQFGFDQFIDIKSFAPRGKSGPYIGDITLAEMIGAELTQPPGQPVFLFVITMENHGPLHLEKPFPGESTQYCTTPLPQGCDDLIIYLRHLRNADRMAGMLAQSLQSLDQEAWLCWYGDHVPILPEVYKTFGNPTGATDYFLWSNRQEKNAGRYADQQVEQLALLVLREMGFMD
ncbi:MAG: LTA synthase family protein, partial [Desulfobulbus sp.]|nr:LTA synthase family protein [Desulfobulbus sp.]